MILSTYPIQKQNKMILFFLFEIFFSNRIMDSYRLRSIIIKLQDNLSDDDRKCLHFFLGPDIPRRIRDDPSLGGTLSLMEVLFDQDKINGQDFTFLIDAFDENRCYDAAKTLQGYLLYFFF